MPGPTELPIDAHTTDANCTRRWRWMLNALATSCSSVWEPMSGRLSRSDLASIFCSSTSGTLSVVVTHAIVAHELLGLALVDVPVRFDVRGDLLTGPVVVRLVDRFPPGTGADAEQPRLGERVVEVAAEQAERSGRIAVLDAVEDAHLFEPVDATLHRARLPAEAPGERAHRIGEHLAGVASCVIRKSIGRYPIADPAVSKHVRPPKELDVRCPAPSRSARIVASN